MLPIVLCEIPGKNTLGEGKNIFSHCITAVKKQWNDETTTRIEQPCSEKSGPWLLKNCATDSSCKCDAKEAGTEEVKWAGN
jgi:hypothetical protein